MNDRQLEESIPADFEVVTVIKNREEQQEGNLHLLLSSTDWDRRFVDDILSKVMDEAGANDEHVSIFADGLVETKRGEAQFDVSSWYNSEMPPPNRRRLLLADYQNPNIVSAGMDDSGLGVEQVITSHLQHEYYRRLIRISLFICSRTWKTPTYPTTTWCFSPAAHCQRPQRPKSPKNKLSPTSIRPYDFNKWLIRSHLLFNQLHRVEIIEKTFYYVL